ncbi:BnaC04g53830D, partial [Brassica napus]
IVLHWELRWEAVFRAFFSRSDS